MAEEWKTRHTLLKRAQNSEDPKVWEEFASSYKPFIYHVLHKMNVSLNDFDDLVQEVLLRLWKNLDSYDRSKAKFRTWFSRMIRNLTLDYLASTNKKKSYQEQFAKESEPGGIWEKANDSAIEEFIEKEWKVYLSNLAFEKMKSIFSGSAVDVLSLSLQGKSNQEIAEELDLKIDSVKVLKHRVRSRFKDEIKHLISELES